MMKRRYQEEVLLSFLGSPVFCGGEERGLTWDQARAGDAGRVLTRGRCEMKETVSSRAPLPETEVGSLNTFCWPQQNTSCS